MHVPVTHPDAHPFRWEGRAPACLLIHGLTSTPWEVRPVGLALRGAGYHAESLWLPGHGLTPEALSRVTWQEWTDAVEQQYDALHEQYGAVAALGTSLGGSLALWLGVTRDPVALVAMGAAIRLPAIARLARFIARFRPFQNKRPQGSAIFDDEARRRHPSYRKSSLHAIAEMRDFVEQLRPRLPEITAPLLVMHARQDSVVDPSNATWIMEHAGSKEKELIWLENSDHIITEDYDHPIVTRAAVEWIEQVAARGHEREEENRGRVVL